MAISKYDTACSTLGYSDTQTTSIRCPCAWFGTVFLFFSFFRLRVGNSLVSPRVRIWVNVEVMAGGEGAEGDLEVT